MLNRQAVIIYVMRGCNLVALSPAAALAFTLDLPENAPCGVYSGKNPCLSPQREETDFALLGSNENRNTRKGALSQAVHERGLRLCETVVLSVEHNSNEERMLDAFFEAHSDERAVFAALDGKLERCYAATTKDWAALFDCLFDYFAKFGDEWNEHEDGADKLCSQFEQKIGSYGLYEKVRFVAF